MLPTQRLNGNAKYYSISTKTGYQCSDMTCPKQQHKAEIFKGLFTCVPCYVYPTPYCVGNHMCGFENNVTFASATAQVRAKLNELLKNISVSLKPSWTDWLSYVPGYTYNPQPLQNLYNAMMEKVNGVCSSTRTIPPFSECQNDGHVRKLQSHYKTYYKINDGYVIPPNNSLLWTLDNWQLFGSNIVSWAQTGSSHFIQDLLDSSTCSKATLESLVCFDTGSAFQILNPNTMGDFEVQEGCDVINVDGSRVIDAKCNMVCNTMDSNDQYNTFTGTNYGDLAARTQCGLRHGQLSRFLTMRSSYDINLCSKVPQTPSTCPYMQGMAGGSDGSPVSSLYGTVSWPKPAVASGLFVNPILRKQSAPIGNITLNPTDIGGHFIRMRISSSGTLSVFDIPLRSNYGTIENTMRANTSSWITEYLQARDLSVYTLKTCLTWSCPIQKRHFWTGLGRQKPIVPDPQRTRVLYGSTVHPAMRQQTNAWLAPYKTRNGFCVCVQGDSCQPSSGPCSLAETIKSLYDFQYRSALAVQTPCLLQSDWPYTGGTMRDNSYLAPNTASCAVLDRIPPYRFRYMNSKQYGEGTSTTLAEGSACHMGRPVQYSSAVERCTLMTKTDSTFILSCNGSTVTLPRPRSNFTSVKRFCNQCDKLPKYRSANNKTVPNEVSYGTLWRWSPARLLARDLRFRLCGNATTCDAAADWTLDTFWPSMYSDVAQLFELPAPDPEPAWASQWMLCTGSNGSNCHGTASKAEWLRDRAGTCNRIRGLPNAKDAVANLTICNLDSRLNNLCNVIQNARYKLFEANCQITGACRTSSFFYTPGTYNLVNNEFVRDTVSYFYNFSVPGSCPVLDEETARIIHENTLTSGDCASTDLEAVQMALRFARAVVHIFVEIYFYSAKIAVEVLSLLFGGDVSAMMQNIVTDFRFIVQKFTSFFQQCADLIYKLITETGQLGRWLRSLILQICNFLNAIFDKVIRPLICGIRKVVLALMWFAAKVVDAINFLNIGALSDASDKIQNARESISNSWHCDISSPFNCETLDQIAGEGSATLPVATRCWVGDQSVSASAGCRASDTCLNDDGSLIVCGACANSANMVRYGCNSLTKTCHCHTFPQDYTGCTSHQECYLPDTGCAYMDAYLQPSFGNVPCKACTTQPQCLFSGGTGQCVCLLRPISYQTCAIGGEIVVPDSTKLCLYSSTPSLSNSKYKANYRTLASSACALLNSAQAYCMQVWLNAETSALYVVGLSMLRSRRLLAIAPSPANFSLEPCKSIMSTSDKRPFEIWAASECDKWYQIGEYTITKFNLSAEPSDFTTLSGMAIAIMSSDSIPEVALHLIQYTDIFMPLAKWIANLTIVIARRPVVRKLRKMYNSSHWYYHQHYHNKTRSVLPVRNNNRRILQTWKDNLQAIKTYNIKIASGADGVSAPDASEWTKGPFTWPPTYNYWDTTYPCLAGELLFNYTLKTVQTTVQFYSNSGPSRPALPTTFMDSLPQIKKIGTQSKPMPWFIDMFNQFFSVDYIRYYISSDRGQPSQMSTDIRTFLSCNFEHMQHCSGQYRSLGWGLVVVFVAFVCVSTLLRTIGVTGFDTLLVLGYFPCVLFYTYTYAIFCWPMIPTCIGDDIVALVEWVLPAEWQWPAVMQRWPGCLDGTPGNTSQFEPKSADCLLSCQEWPFSYNTWQDNAAWAWCTTVSCDPGQQGLQYWQMAYDLVSPYVPAMLLDLFSPTPFIAALRQKAPFLMLDDMRSAQWMCWSMTIVQFAPLIAAIALVVALVVALASVAVYVIQFIFNVFIALFVFIHVH